MRKSMLKLKFLSGFFTVLCPALFLCLYASSVFAQTNPIPAVYASSTTFTVSGDQTPSFVAGAIIEVFASSGLRTTMVTSSSYSSGTGLTTVTVNTAVLTAYLTNVTISVLSSFGLYPLSSLPGVLQPGQLYGDGSLLSNYTKLRHWHKSVGDVISGYGSAKVLFVGDSTTFGYNSNNSASAPWHPGAVPTHIATLLNNYGINAHSNAWFGCGKSAISDLNYDGRVTFTGTWTSFKNGTSALSFPYSSVSGSTLTFAPSTQVDTFVIWYLDVGTNQFQWKINSGTYTNVTLTNTNLFKSVSVMGSLGTNTLTINNPANANVFIAGMEAYNSTSKWVECINIGVGSTASPDWATNGAWQPLTLIGAIAPNLTVINLGINDWGTSYNTTPSSYISNMQAIITAAQVSGDVILVTPNPTEIGTWNTTTPQSIVSAIYALAYTNNLCVIDLFSRWTSWAISNPLGLYYSNVHPSQSGYSDIAQTEMRYLVGDR